MFPGTEAGTELKCVLCDAQQPGGDACSSVRRWTGWFWGTAGFLSRPQNISCRAEYSVPLPAKPDVMLPLSHLWARSAFIALKREGRKGKGGSAGLCLPSPFGAWSPARTVMGKASTDGVKRLCGEELLWRVWYKSSSGSVTHDKAKSLGGQ